MVILSKLEVKDFTELGFKNKSKGIAFISGILQTKANKYKTVDDLKNHLRPKLHNLTTLGIDINDKANSDAFKLLKINVNVVCLYHPTEFPKLTFNKF